MFSELILQIVQSVNSWGYLGIFLAMFLESSFFPFPSEVVMIPAGYLSSKGEMNLVLSILVGTLGSIAGAIFNYYLAISLGRKLLLKYGKYLFLDEKSLNKLESFFQKHGEISTFIGRLIPGIRQYISLPAGLAKMNISKFTLYTALGAGIWMVVLTLIGYLIGENEALVKEYLKEATILALGFVATVGAIYYLKNQKRQES